MATKKPAWESVRGSVLVCPGPASTNRMRGEGGACAHTGGAPACEGRRLQAHNAAAAHARRSKRNQTLQYHSHQSVQVHTPWLERPMSCASTQGIPTHTHHHGRRLGGRRQARAPGTRTNQGLGSCVQRARAAFPQTGFQQYGTSAGWFGGGRGMQRKPLARCFCTQARAPPCLHRRMCNGRRGGGGRACT